MMTMHRTGRRTLRALGLAAVSGLVLAVACETPGPTEASDPERRPVELEEVVQAGEAGSLRADGVRVGASDSCPPLVYVDGAVGEWEEVRTGLAPEDIARIEVLKGPASESECGTIKIYTKEASPEARERARRTDEALKEARRRAAQPTAGELAANPTFTPMTERPQYQNLREMQEELIRHYPPLLRDAGIGGTANVWFFIDETGRVRNTRINQSSGYDALDQAALKLAELAEFSPAYNGDERVPVWIALDITFEAY